jgi:hypothetical protein
VRSKCGAEFGNIQECLISAGSAAQLVSDNTDPKRLEWHPL